MSTAKEAAGALVFLRRWMPAQQAAAVKTCLFGEERQFFINKVCELQTRILSMPEPYATDGQGDNATVWLHYFLGAFDWYIIERDSTVEQHQAFGFADMGEPELGYISIVEVINAGAELDLYFTPTTLGEVKKAVAKKHGFESVPV